MPTYNVHYTAGTLDADQKHRIARRITEAHSANTGAQQFFAQVLFREISLDGWYLAGEPLTEPHLFVLGFIRSGRALDVKARLLHSIRDLLVEHGGVSVERAWVYLCDVPAAHIVEYGEILPEPGQEQGWLDALPNSIRGLLGSTTK